MTADASDRQTVFDKRPRGLGMKADVVGTEEMSICPAGGPYATGRPAEGLMPQAVISSSMTRRPTLGVGRLARNPCAPPHSHIPVQHKRSHDKRPRGLGRRLADIPVLRRIRTSCTSEGRRCRQEREPCSGLSCRRLYATGLPDEGLMPQAVISFWMTWRPTLRVGKRS